MSSSISTRKLALTPLQIEAVLWAIDVARTTNAETSYEPQLNALHRKLSTPRRAYRTFSR